MSLPQLPIPKQGELYAQFVVEEYNCNYCPPGLEVAQDQGSLTKHITWIYQSANHLQKGDIMLIYAEYIFLSPDYKDPYYEGGLIQALIDAMIRGAKVFILTERFWIGGRNKDGECVNCKEIGESWGCDKESKVGVMGTYICAEYNNMLKVLTEEGGDNFILYDIDYKYQDVMKIHSHFKTVSCYYQSTNTCSVYKGSWNTNMKKFGSDVEEAGFGFVGVLDESWAQYQLYVDTQHLKIMENYYEEFTRKSSKTVITTLLKDYKRGDIPIQPIIIPKLIICGPNYCDPAFGCGANGGIKCNQNESWVNAIDKDVVFTFGVDPKPQNNKWQVNWNEKGWDKSMISGTELMANIISSSKKFLKIYIHGELLDRPKCYNPGNCGTSDLIPEVEESLHNILLNNVPVFVIQNDGWQNVDGDKFIDRVYRNKSEKENLYAKTIGLCGKVRKRGYQRWDSGTNMTHTKLWISDNSVLIQTSHPDIIHTDVDLTNNGLLIQNSPNMVNFMNNHFNYVYNKCGLYTSEYPPVGKYKDQILSCTVDNKACCTGQNYSIFTSPGPFGGCIYRDNKIPLPIPIPEPEIIPIAPKPEKKPDTDTVDRKQNMYKTKQKIPVIMSLSTLCIIFIVIVLFIKVSKRIKTILIIFAIIIFGITLFLNHEKSVNTTVIINPSEPITKSKFSISDYQLMKKYLLEIYPTSDWFKTASDKKIGEYILNLSFYYRGNSTTIGDIMTKVSGLKPELDNTICPTADCCPHDYSKNDKTRYCDGKLCLYTDEQLDSRKYGILADVNELVWYTAMIGLYEVLVLRNQYNPVDWTKSIAYAPPATIAGKKSRNQGPIKLKTGGYPSGEAIEVFRLHSISGSPDIFYYVGVGSGNFLKLGQTLQAVDKIDAMLKIISMSGKYGFAGFNINPVMHGNYAYQYEHQTETDPNTFIDNPEFLLLELLECSGKNVNTVEGGLGIPDETFQFSLSIPNKKVLDFIKDIGMLNNTLGKNVNGNYFPYNECSVGAGSIPRNYVKWYKADAGLPNIKPLLIWYFNQKNVKVPDNFWYKNIKDWSSDQKICLRNFFLNISDPYINLEPLKKINLSWEARYVLNRIPNSEACDFLIRSFIVQGDKFSSTGYDVNGQPWIGLPGLVDTIQLSIQAGGYGGWDYEIIDFRFNMSDYAIWPPDDKEATSKIATPNAIEKWNEYSEKYMYSGSPFMDDKMINCQFNFESDKSFVLSYCKR